MLTRQGMHKKDINKIKSNKRDGQTDGQTDGRGALQYLPSRAFGAAGDNNLQQ